MIGWRIDFIHGHDDHASMVWSVKITSRRPAENSHRSNFEAGAEKVPLFEIIELNLAKIGKRGKILIIHGAVVEMN